MVNDVCLLGSILLGVLMTLIYVLIQARAHRKPYLSDGVVIFLSSAGIIAGIKVCGLSLDSSVFRSMGTERLYVFIGGLAVIWVSLQALWKPLERAYRDPRMPNNGMEGDK